MWFGYLLLVLLPIAAVGYIVWDHKRKIAQREADSAGRMEALLGVAVHAPRAEVADTVSDPAAVAGELPRPAMPYVLRERLLTPPQTLLYYLLKTSLPDHAVFAQMSVATVLDSAATVAAYAREEQARIFARHIVDFVITDKSTRPVTVLKLTHAGETQPAALSAMRTWFAAAGVRFVEIDAAALPRKDAVRALVLGDSATDASARSEAMGSPVTPAP